MKTFNFDFVLYLASIPHSPTKEKVELKFSDIYKVLDLKNKIKPDFRSEFKKLFINEREYFDQEGIHYSHLAESCKKNEVKMYLDDEIHIRFKFLDKIMDDLLEITIATNVIITFQQLLNLLKAQYLIDFEGDVFLPGMETPIMNKELDVIWNYKISNYTTFCLKYEKNFYQTQIAMRKEESKRANDDKRKELDIMREKVEKEVKPLLTRHEKIAEYDLLKERLKNDVCTLMFLGGVSVGKTTLINKILSSFLDLENAEEILKTHEKENTRFIWVLKHGKYVSITFDKNSEEPYESIKDELFKERIKELNKRQKLLKPHKRYGIRR